MPFIYNSTYTSATPDKPKKRLYQSAPSGNFYYFLIGGEKDDGISLKDSWFKYDGHYVFTDGTITADQVEKAMKTAAIDPLQDERLILWLHPNGSTADLLGSLMFKVAQWSNFGVITKADNLAIGNYELPMMVGMMIYPSSDGSLLEAIDFTEATQFSFAHQESKYIGSSTQNVLFGATSTIAGVFTGMAMISDFSDNPASGWGVGFRYFMNDDGETISKFYPVFENPVGSYILFKMQWDLFNPLDDTKTYLEYTLKSIQLGVDEANNGSNHLLVSDLTENAVISSNFRTRLGQIINLQPYAVANRKPKLVFQKREKGENDAQQYYLTPEGSFAMMVEGGETGDQFDLLMGLVGTEYAKFTQSDTMFFTPGQNARATVFPAAKVQAQSSHLSVLDNKYLTAWVLIFSHPTTPITYYSQPESSPLYQFKPSDKTTGNKAFQTYYDDPILTLSGGSGSGSQLGDSSTLFPILPYGGFDEERIRVIGKIKGTGFRHAAFESQVISPTRKSQIDQLDKVADSKTSDTEITTITPQGLLVTLDKETAKWKEVHLAVNKVEATTYHLNFKNLSKSMVQAFQSSQQFMVISNSTELGALPYPAQIPPLTITPDEASFGNKINIDGWPFIFDIPATNNTTGAYENVMIIKYAKGSLADLVKTPQGWTLANKLVGTQSSQKQSLSAWLNNFIQQGISAAKTDADFEQFAEIATDPNWNGVIGLNINVDFKSFPTELQGLIAGIDESKFKAHHVGVQVNQPKVVSNLLSLGEHSNLFGLINYTNAEITPNQVANQDFDFNVLELKVVFKHSQITKFKGKIQLLINKLMGCDVSYTTVNGQVNDDNSLIFDSRYEVHDGNPVYTFNDLQDTRFYMDNSVLEYIEITKSTFNTLIPASAPNFDISTRFTMWGYLGFATQGTHVDLLSYGEPQGQTKARSGLSFSNMLVDMSFSLDSPTKVTYTADVAHLDFDRALSTLRPGSLLDSLYMTIAGLRQGGEDNPLTQQGFMPMSLELSSGAEAPNLKEPKGDWTGFVYEVNLGGLGALVGKTSFVVKLLIAWANEASPGAYPLSVGMAFPGANSAGQLFNLEGILKLTMDGVKLVEKDGVYMIKISDIALKLLGVKIPPGATTEFEIFGDPSTDQATRSKKIGWFGTFQP